MDDINQLIQLLVIVMGNKFLLVFCGLWVLGYMLKEHTLLNNKMIPWFIFVAGIGLGILLIQWTLPGAIIGGVMAWIVMGVYEHIKNTIEVILNYKLKGLASKTSTKNRGGDV